MNKYRDHQAILCNYLIGQGFSYKQLFLMSNDSLLQFFKSPLVCRKKNNYNYRFLPPSRNCGGAPQVAQYYAPPSWGHCR